MVHYNRITRDLAEEAEAYAYAPLFPVDGSGANEFRGIAINGLEPTIQRRPDATPKRQSKALRVCDDLSAVTALMTTRANTHVLDLRRRKGAM